MATLSGWAEHQVNVTLKHGSNQSQSLVPSCSCSTAMWTRTRLWWTSWLLRWLLVTSASCLRAGTARCVWERRSWPASSPVSQQNPSCPNLSCIRIFTGLELWPRKNLCSVWASKHWKKSTCGKGWPLDRSHSTKKPVLTRLGSAGFRLSRSVEGYREGQPHLKGCAGVSFRSLEAHTPTSMERTIVVPVVDVLWSIGRANGSSRHPLTYRCCCRTVVIKALIISVWFQSGF